MPFEGLTSHLTAAAAPLLAENERVGIAGRVALFAPWSSAATSERAPPSTLIWVASEGHPIGQGSSNLSSISQQSTDAFHLAFENPVAANSVLGSANGNGR
jgi:hypothetical protein